MEEKQNISLVRPSNIKLFEGRQIRSTWNEEDEEWYFVVEDVVAVLTDSADPKQYVKRLKLRDPELAKGWVQIVPTLVVQTEGGPQKMKVANAKGLFRIIQSIPSKKAEPFKQWLAKVGAERLNQIQDPERNLQQMIADYRRLGHDEAWINQRIKSIQIRKGLTEEWQRGGVTEDNDFAFLTDLISVTWSGMNTRQYKNFKGLHKENLRDNMTDVELMLSGLAEATSTALSKKRNPKQMTEHAGIAKEGGEVARAAREDIEHRLGESVISPQKAIDIAIPKDELPFPKKE